MTPRAKKIIGLAMMIVGGFLLWFGIDSALNIGSAMATTGENYGVGAIFATLILATGGIVLVTYGNKYRRAEIVKTKN